MPDEAERIAAIKTQTLDLIEQVRAEPKPTYWLDGQRVHWQEYVESLQATVDWCDAKLAAYEPYEMRSQGGSR